MRARHHLHAMKYKYEDRPFQALLDNLNKVQVVDLDYWRDNKVCLLGLENPINSYTKYPDMDYLSEQIVGWNINASEHLNLGVIAGSGIGKCITRDNLLLLDNGTRITVKDYYDRKLKNKICTYNEELNEIEFVEPIVHLQNPKPRTAFQIVTDGGFTIDVTDNHRMLCMGENGKLFEKLSQDITCEDFLCVHTPEQKHNPNLKTHYPKSLINFDKIQGFALRKNFRNYIQKHKYITYNLLYKIDDVKDYPFRILKVRKITTRPINEETYDVEVPKNHNFFTGEFGLILNHNTKIIKNIIADYHKAGWRILIFSPKEDEWSSAKRKGQATHLHPATRTERLPIVSYCPPNIKFWMKQNNFSTAKYKFYSHPISSFSIKEVWTALDMSPKVANVCAKLVNRGVKTLQELREGLEGDKDLFEGMRRSADIVIDSILGTKFIDESLPPLELDKEWGWFHGEGDYKYKDNNNVVVINYFAQRGSYMTADVWRVLNLARETAQRARKKKHDERILVLLDDANYYARKGEGDKNAHCIGAITDLMVNWRKLGFDCITAYQFPDVVHGDVVQASTKKLVSFIEDPNSLNGILPVEAVNILKYPPERGGLVINKPFDVQWIYRKDSRDFWVFYPQNCKVGHDFN